MDLRPKGATPQVLAVDETPRGHTVASYFEAFAPVPAWDDLVTWPPDVFCLCNLLLDHTEGYRFAVAPPPGRHWPPSPEWNDEVAAASRQWRSACAPRPGGDVPGLVRRSWDALTGARDVPLSLLRTGEAWEACEALLTLHALADEACSELSLPDPAAGPSSMADLAWSLLEETGSLSRVSPVRVRIVPKTNFAARGITIRSLSRYLALCYEAVEVRWRRVRSEIEALRTAAGPRGYNVMLLPWPREVRARDFRSVPSPLGNMDPEVFGFFEFAPRQPLPPTYVEALLDRARDDVGRVDAVVLPEGSVDPDEVEMLEDLLAASGVRFLVAGVRRGATEGAFGRNYLHFGVLAADGWRRYRQDKHHRWCLDEAQIRQYHLSRALDPHRLWWEAIELPNRELNVIDVGGGATAAPLVCEDLARLDEVADLLRRIGPSIVLAVLLDGPQLATRWSCRYASVLSDEPGSAVLTLTSFGMVRRSRPPGLPPSRVVALWNDGRTGLREIELGAGADAVLLETALRTKTVWTADGRRHEGVPELTLAGLHQLRAGAGRVVGQAGGS